MKFIIIIPVALKSQAEAMSKQIDPTSVGEDFVTPLRTVGGTAITHWANLPNVTDEGVIAAIRQLAQAAAIQGGIYLECGPGSVRAQFLALLAEHGLEEMPVEGE
jgi:hypothetical protein